MFIVNGVGCPSSNKTSQVSCSAHKPRLACLAPGRDGWRRWGNPVSKCSQNWGVMNVDLRWCLLSLQISSRLWRRWVFVWDLCGDGCLWRWLFPEVCITRLWPRALSGMDDPFYKEISIPDVRTERVVLNHRLRLDDPTLSSVGIIVFFFIARFSRNKGLAFLHGHRGDCLFQPFQNHFAFVNGGLCGHPWGTPLPRFHTNEAAIVSLLHPAGYAFRQCWWHGSSCQRSRSTTCHSWSWSRGGWGRDWHFGSGRRSGRVSDDFGACWMYSKHIKIHQTWLVQQLSPKPCHFRFMLCPNPRTLLEKPPCEGQWHIFSAGSTRPGSQLESVTNHVSAQENATNHHVLSPWSWGTSGSWGPDWMVWCFAYCRWSRSCLACIMHLTCAQHGCQDSRFAWQRNCVWQDARRWVRYREVG